MHPHYDLLQMGAAAQATVAAPVPRHPAINHQNPGLLTLAVWVLIAVSLL